MISSSERHLELWHFDHCAGCETGKMRQGDNHQTVAILLAAGSGSRYSGHEHKLLAPLHGRPLWRHALDTVLLAGALEVIVVTGAATLDELTTLVDADHRLHQVQNDHWQSGQASSLLAGVKRAREMGADAAVVGLADQPGISQEAWSLVSASTSDLAVADYGDRRGHPVRIARRFWDELPSNGDIGAREVLSRHASIVEPIPCKGSPDDIDTVKDLQRWLRRSPTNSP